MEKTGKQVSNLEECVESAIKISRKLATAWDLSDYKGKQALQFLVFPNGIFYNRQNEQCRTSDVSPVFHCIAGLAREIEGKKEGGDQVYLVAARCVAPKGIEPLPKVPETFVLSIKLRSHPLKECKGKDFSMISIR